MDDTPTLPIAVKGPRAVRRKAGRPMGMGCVQVFLIPHTLVALGLVVMVIHSLANLAFGLNAPGDITARDTYYTSKSHTLVYRLYFEYIVGGEHHSGKTTVDADAWLIYPPHSSIVVRVLPQTPEWAPVAMTAPDSALRDAGVFFLFALFWCGIMSFVCWAVYVTPWANKRLLQVGHAVAGNITSKNVTFNKTTSYTVKYRFTPDGSVFSRANGQRTIRLDVGQPCRVFHSEGGRRRDSTLCPKYAKAEHRV